jgi:DNA-binding response OmpR family regulator
MRILVVEAELTIVIDVEACLSEKRHQAAGRSATRPTGSPVSPKTALSLSRWRRPDLALVDVHPFDSETGPEIARCLKDLGIPVIIMTANPDLSTGWSGWRRQHQSECSSVSPTS